MSQRVLHRVIMPVDRDPDVLKLYVEGDVVHGVDGSELDTDNAEILGRRSLAVPPGTRASLCTYFNAFPASHWRRWTVLEKITLRLEVSGEGTIIVYRSTSKGNVQRVESFDFDSATTVEKTVDLSLQPFIDGGWYWFDVLGGTRTVQLEQAEWCAESDRAQGSTTIGITSFNRPKFCVDQLTALSESGDVLDVIDEILVIDQGSQRVDATEDFPTAAASLGAKLRVIDQANLGGSGGFSRAMVETLKAETSDYVLLMDDDVVSEPESILRVVAFADHARTPTIVGGHMFDLYDRPVLHAYAEGIAPYRWWMVPARNTHYWHDLSVHTLKQTHWLHQRADADFSGWWMCLIPVDVLRKIGLSLPVFIKWDDIEYGIRAKAAGFPTVPLPGTAVWHVPWRDKDNDLDWQAYFQERNRIISALLHSPYERGGNMIKESFIMVTKHAMAMQYSTAELMLRGIEDVFRGPDALHPTMAAKMGEIRAVRSGFIDAETRDDLEAFPRIRRRKPPRKGREGATPPANRKETIRAALVGGLKQLKPVDEFTRKHPQTVVPHVEQRWWVLTKLDSALVSSADGTKAAWYQRSPKQFRELMQRNTALHARLYREWEQLTGVYRESLPVITAPDTWSATFDDAGPAAR